MSNKIYKSIGEVAELLNLVDKNTGKNTTHTLRFWEKEFYQIKPKIFSGNRRYYDENAIKILKKIKFLLKDKGMTIKGAKKALENENTSIDEFENISINAKNNIRNKIRKISSIIKDLKK